MKTIIRLLLRIPYFYYWSWKQYPYNFELWLIFYVGYWLAKSPLKNLKIIVPREYHDLIKKYPDFNPFMALKELAANPPKEKGGKRFYHYEDFGDGNGEVKASDKAGPPITITVNKGSYRN